MTALSVSGTHLPVLQEAVRRTTGPILELGVGPNSTPWLHDHCLQYVRDLWSFDNNPEWLEPYLSMRHPNHNLCCVEDWALTPYERGWGLAFVDQSPGEARYWAVMRLRYHAKVVVAHDSEPEQDGCYQYSKVRGLYRYQRDWTALHPHTLILSNYEDVRGWTIPAALDSQ